MNEFDIKLSKTLSFLLRHSANRTMNPPISFDSEGFVAIDSILSLPQMNRYSFDDIERVVRTNDKQRFTIIKRSETENGEDGPSGKSALIRANQGHTFKVPNLELREISLDQPAEYELVHATFLKNWSSIRQNGLSRMKREHIHFLTRLPSFEERQKISGKLKHCDLFIFVDMKRALSEGHKFHISVNNVVLCPGNDKGVLEPKYFCSVLTGKAELTKLSY